MGRHAGGRGDTEGAEEAHKAGWNVARTRQLKTASADDRAEEDGPHLESLTCLLPVMICRFATSPAARKPPSPPRSHQVGYVRRMLSRKHFYVLTTLVLGGAVAAGAVVASAVAAYVGKSPTLGWTGACGWRGMCVLAVGGWCGWGGVGRWDRMRLVTWTRDGAVVSGREQVGCRPDGRRAQSVPARFLALAVCGWCERTSQPPTSPPPLRPTSPPTSPPTPSSPLPLPPGRSMTLLDPTYASRFVPIIASVSEHQPPQWSSYIMDLHILVALAPAGGQGGREGGGEAGRNGRKGMEGWLCMEPGRPCVFVCVCVCVCV